MRKPYTASSLELAPVCSYQISLSGSCVVESGGDFAGQAVTASGRMRTNGGPTCLALCLRQRKEGNRISGRDRVETRVILGESCLNTGNQFVRLLFEKGMISAKDKVVLPDQVRCGMQSSGVIRNCVEPEFRQFLARRDRQPLLGTCIATPGNVQSGDKERQQYSAA